MMLMMTFMMVMIAMGSEVNKKLVCRPFVPKRMPTTNKPIIKGLIYDRIDRMKKAMMSSIIFSWKCVENSFAGLVCILF